MELAVSAFGKSPLARCFLLSSLLGTPVEIDASGANVKSATIIFHYDPAQLNSVAPSDLAIVWYDEENDVVKLLENGVVDTTNHTVSVQTTHFSRYAVVDQNQWNEAWGTVLPVIRTEETPTTTSCWQWISLAV